MAIAFGWGLAEGTLFFIVPDVFLTLLALGPLGPLLLAWAGSILGSLAAVLLLFRWMAADPGAVLNLIEALPGISPEMIASVTAAMAHHGLPWSPLLVTGGIPLKVYAVAAAGLQLPLASVLPWTLFARVVRIGPVLLLALAVKRLAGQSVRRHPRRWFWGVILAWTGFYMIYFQRMGW
ncbi:MAG: hypothetical protein ER33_00545 [Cyanobium sp. CACIAM 14]|nr:MAG: hypothetical protein ER33_00545 [Cyanobium sp. CACIAM 14]